MVLKIFLSFIISIFFVYTAYPLSRENKAAFSNIKKVELIDKDYRTMAVLPFENLTGSDPYSYIGKTFQKFVSGNLSLLKNIQVSTNDYYIPEKYKTNKNIIYSYSTNKTRNVIILDSDTLYKKFVEFPAPDNLKFFSKSINADYLIAGFYKFDNKQKDKINLFYYIYNAVRDEKIYTNGLLFDVKNIEPGIEQISDEIIRYFYSKKNGFIRIITDFSNYELFVNDRLRIEKEKLFKLPVRQYQVKFRTLGYHPFVTNIIVKNDMTNNLKFFKNDFQKEVVKIKVNSFPANASVYLDVKYLGNTPLFITNILKDNYRITIKKSNYFTHYKNVDLINGTNQFNIYLEKNYSKEYYENKHKNNKIIMYSSLGLGMVSLLGTYYFGASMELEYDKYLLYRKRENYDKSNLYLNLMVVSGIITAGSLTVSLIYFFKVINYDDKNIGMNNQPWNMGIAFKNSNHIFSVFRKF